MSYTKTTWIEHGMTEGEKVTALNNLETMVASTEAAVQAHLHGSIYYTKAEVALRFFGPANDGAGSGMNAGLLDGYTADEIISSSIPPGIIIMSVKSGYSAPVGWENYSEMDGRYPVGAGSSYGLLEKGGGMESGSFKSPVGTVNGTAITENEMPAHTHTFRQNTNAGNPAYRKNDSDQVYCWANYPGDGSGVWTNTDYAADSAATYAAGQAHTHTATVSGSVPTRSPPYVVVQFLKKLVDA